MTDPAWKKLERKVAKNLHGRRIPCSGVSSDFKGDVETDSYLIDCKHGKQIPKTIISWFEKIKKDAEKVGKEPALVLKPKGKHYELVVISMQNFKKLVEGDRLYETESGHETK